MLLLLNGLLCSLFDKLLLLGSLLLLLLNNLGLLSSLRSGLLALFGARLIQLLHKLHVMVITLHCLLLLCCSLLLRRYLIDCGSLLNLLLLLLKLVQMVLGRI